MLRAIFISSTFIISLAFADSQVAELAKRLRRLPVDQAALITVLSSPSSQEIREALRSAFLNAHDKSDKQAIASTLVEIGQADDEIFNYLSKFAKMAIGHQAPIFIKYDSAGHAVRKEYNQEFEIWCKLNNVDVQQELKLQMLDLPNDVRLFARTLDPRTIPLLKEGILSSNPWIAETCAESLGLQGRNEISGSLIAAIERTPGDSKEVLASALPLFSNPESVRAFERFTPDEHRRERWRKEAVQARSSYQKKILLRSGAAIQ